MKTREKGLGLGGKVAVVTGGATGIGEAICKVFAAAGARVVVNGLPGDPVDDVVKEIVAAGGTATACVTDAATEARAGCSAPSATPRAAISVAIWPAATDRGCRHRAPPRSS